MDENGLPTVPETMAVTSPEAMAMYVAWLMTERTVGIHSLADDRSEMNQVEREIKDKYEDFYKEIVKLHKEAFPQS